MNLCLSSMVLFKGSRLDPLDGPPPEQEAFAIVESVTRLDYVLLRPEGFFLFTDHKNLIYIFDPVGSNPKIAKHVANKVERWAMKLAAFRYAIVHISGEDNHWADLLSRWGASDLSIESNQSPSRISALFSAPIAPDLDPEFKWPSKNDISEAQEAGLMKKGESSREKKMA